MAFTTSGWGSTPTSPVDVKSPVPDEVETNGAEEGEKEKVDKGKEKATEGLPVTKKFRGIPEDVKLFEVFWQQVVELIKVRSAPKSYLLS